MECNDQSKTLSTAKTNMVKYGEQQDVAWFQPIATAPSPKETNTRKDEGCRGKVMHDGTAARKVKDLAGMINKVLNPPPTRDGASSKKTSNMQKLAKFRKDECSPVKVFGCPFGELPAVPDIVKECPKKYDCNATKVLTVEVCELFAAFAVDVDGNCFWRAVARCLWNSDCFWQQLKLVVLGYAAGNAEDLVTEGRHLHQSVVYYSTATFKKFQRSVRDKGDDKFSVMLLTEVKDLCPSGGWGGALSAHLTSEALGITVKIVDPNDMKARRRHEDSDIPIRGSGRRGSSFGDNRVSRHFVPQGGPCEWCVHGGNGKADIFRQEVTLIFASYHSDSGVDEEELVDVGEVGKDTDVFGLNHFASAMRKDGSSAIFPLHLCAPSLFPALDEVLQQRSEAEVA